MVNSIPFTEAQKEQFGGAMSHLSDMFVHGCPIYYGCYELLSNRRDPSSIIIAGCVAGGVSSVVAHPIDVLKTNAQQEKPVPMHTLLSQPKWYVRGLSFVLVSVVPATAVCFYTFEHVLNRFESHRHRS